MKEISLRFWFSIMADTSCSCNWVSCNSYIDFSSSTGGVSVCFTGSTSIKSADACKSNHLIYQYY